MLAPSHYALGRPRGARASALPGFGGAVGSQSRPMNLPNDLTSFTATIIRLGRGVFPRVTAERRRDPDLLLELYDFEACPYCRKVREVLSELDLEYMVRTVPKGSARRAALTRRGGKMQVPYLVDPNTRREMYESDDIIAYLEGQYA